VKPNEFLNQLEGDRIVAAIREAERKTSGEIRVFVTHKKIENAVPAAQEAFTRLGMTKTRERNGVLIFIAPRARQFAVIGDEAVHRRCGEDFWRQLAKEMSSRFKIAHFTDGIVHVVQKAGALLAEHFPRRDDDRNELSDRVIQD
jgi:uncharacterized membrane protein